MKRYLFIPQSSPGGLYSAIRLGHILTRGGHEVLFATTSEYSIMLETRGLSCIGFRKNDVPFLHPSTWFHPENAAPEVSQLRTDHAQARQVADTADSLLKAAQATQESLAARVKALEAENTKLKRLLADRLLEIDVMKEIASKKW